MKNLRLPADLDYTKVPGLSTEVCQKLNAAKPATIGIASRLPGITPAAISLLLIYLKKRAYQNQKNVEGAMGTLSISMFIVGLRLYF